MRIVVTYLTGAAAALLALGIQAAPNAGFVTELAALQQAWAVANYENSGDSRERDALSPTSGRGSRRPGSPTTRT